MHGVAPRLSVVRSHLILAAAIGTEVIVVGGVSPLGVDRGVVVESALVGRRVGEIGDVVPVVVEVGIHVAVIDLEAT